MPVIACLKRGQLHGRNPAPRTPSFAERLPLHTLKDPSGELPRDAGLGQRQALPPGTRLTQEERKGVRSPNF